MKSNYKKLGDYIQVVNRRNTDLKVKKLLGVSIKKVLMPSIANIVGTNMKTYKIIKRNQFAYGLVTSRNGNKISVALSDEFDEAIVSQAYTVFEVIDKDKLLPEYLMMWFRRPEFDRYARYKSHGSERETFDWEEMCEVKPPIPSIQKQKEIVAEYNTVVNRIKLNEQLNQKLEKTAQAIYKHWFVDFEFPNEQGKPYKSSGGKMIWNEELEKEIPEGWRVEPLISICRIKGGKRLPAGERLTSIPNTHPYIKVADLGIGKYALLNDNYEYVSNEVQKGISRYIVSTNDLIISIVGTIGIAKIIHKSLNLANLTENCAKISDITTIDSGYLYYYFNTKYGKEEITMRNVGAVQAKLPIYNIESFPILCPKKEILFNFRGHVKIIDIRIINVIEEDIQLNKFKDLLLSKMTKVESVNA